MVSSSYNGYMAQCIAAANSRSLAEDTGSDGVWPRDAQDTLWNKDMKEVECGSRRLDAAAMTCPSVDDTPDPS